ncbi:unnamed protein product [Schistosoma bovis]|nr:unnamed protein product [Schistosoma bovis]
MFHSGCLRMVGSCKVAENQLNYSLKGSAHRSKPLGREQISVVFIRDLILDFSIPVFVNLKSHLVSPTTTTISFAFVAQHCSRSFVRLLINLDLICFCSLSCLEPGGMGLRESFSTIDLLGIHWFFVTLWFKSLIDVAAVSIAVCLSFQAIPGSASSSGLPKCDISCSWNILLAFSSYNSILMGLFNVVFPHPLRSKQMRARIRA